MWLLEEHLKAAAATAAHKTRKMIIFELLHTLTHICTHSIYIHLSVSLNICCFWDFMLPECFIAHSFSLFLHFLIKAAGAHCYVPMCCNSQQWIRRSHYVLNKGGLDKCQIPSFPVWAPYYLLLSNTKRCNVKRKKQPLKQKSSKNK